jgi:anaerobic selenocysteine-containing dehydrogenase
MEVTRRGFLSLTGAAAGLLLLPAEFKELLSAVSEHKHRWPGPGIESWINSVCQLCPGGCGIRVRLLDGWPVSIRGIAGHPINRGGLCPKGDAGLQALYDPDRIRRPLKRTGERGKNAWKEISWDEAIGLVAGRLRGLRVEGRPEGLVVIGGQYRGLMNTIWQRFLAAYGSPNDISMGMGCDTSDLVLRLTQGVRGHIGYDLENTNYVLSFGVSLLEGSWSPVWQMRSFADLQQGRPGQRVKIVQVDTRFSMTAAKADEWVPVRPGTDAALALAIAHVIVRDGLQDQAFLRDHGFGFEDWVDDSGRPHEGFRTMILRDYKPSEVAAKTGVPEERITRIAHEFARFRPAIAMGDRGVSRYSNGLYTRWSIHCLNAIVGNLDQPGGILTPPEIPFTPLPPLAPDPVAERGRARPRIDGAGSTEAPLAANVIHRVPEAIRSGQPYPVEAVFLYHANPLFSLPAALGMREALDRVPFVVSFSPYLDESALASDLVLPDHIFLERWQDDTTPRNVGFPVLGIRKPVRAPLYDTRATSDVLFALAKALGGPVRTALPWVDMEVFLKERVQGVCASRRGTLIAGLEATGLGLTPKVLPPSPPPADFDEFWTQLLDRGAWWDAEYPFRDWSRTLRTPSGRFEFYSQTLKEALGKSNVPPGSTAEAELADSSGSRDDIRYLPHQAPPEEAARPEEYPLVLNVFRPLAFTGGSTTNMPYLIEIAGKGVSVSWESWVEIDPATAQSLGIQDRDLVWVESPVGKVKVKARVYPGALPGVVNLPYGFGHQAAGRWAKGLGANANDLLGATAMTAVGASVYPITWVRIHRA